MKEDFEIIVLDLGDALVWTPYTDEKFEEAKFLGHKFQPVKMKVSEYSDYVESKTKGLAD